MSSSQQRERGGWRNEREREREKSRYFQAVWLGRVFRLCCKRRTDRQASRVRGETGRFTSDNKTWVKTRNSTDNGQKSNYLSLFSTFSRFSISLDEGHPAIRLQLKPTHLLLGFKLFDPPTSQNLSRSLFFFYPLILGPSSPAGRLLKIQSPTLLKKAALALFLSSDGLHPQRLARHSSSARIHTFNRLAVDRGDNWRRR